MGSHGFIGSYLIKELADFECCDLKIGVDILDGIDEEYESIVFLACDQGDTREAFEYNVRMYEVLNNYREDHPDTYLIYISSAAIYNINSWYAVSKQVGEAYADRFERRAVLRLSNVYGHGDGHGAPDRFLRGENVINGYGAQIRDLIPVERVVTRILKCLTYRVTGVYNVSSGIGTSVNRMFSIFGSGKPSYNKRADIGVKYSVLEPGGLND